MIVWLVVLSVLLLVMVGAYLRVLSRTRGLARYADGWSKQHEKQLNEHAALIKRQGESIAGLDAALEILLAATWRIPRKELREQLKKAMGPHESFGSPDLTHRLDRLRAKIREDERGAG